jgi:hypothetical protein
MTETCQRKTRENFLSSQKFSPSGNKRKRRIFRWCVMKTVKQDGRVANDRAGAWILLR